MLDHTEFEWVDTDGQPVLLYPGFTSDDALVEPGEIAAAIFNGTDGFALHGDRDKVLASSSGSPTPSATPRPSPPRKRASSPRQTPPPGSSAPSPPR